MGLKCLGESPVLVQIYPKTMTIFHTCAARHARWYVAHTAELNVANFKVANSSGREDERFCRLASQHGRAFLQSDRNSSSRGKVTLTARSSSSTIFHHAMLSQTRRAHLHRIIAEVDGSLDGAQHSVMSSSPCHLLKSIRPQCI